MMPKAANLQKIRDGRRTYAITPGLPGGFVKPEQLRQYADVAEKYGAVMKLTSAQRIMITALRAEDVEAAWRDLGIEPEPSVSNCVRSVKLCPGTAFCKRGLQDSVKLGLELDRRYHKKEMPSHVKMGVAGCPNSCAEVHTKDIGIFGDEDGWTVLAGGCGGRVPRLADVIAEKLDYEETMLLVDVILEYYKEKAEIERVGQLIDRIGLDIFRSEVLERFEAQKPEKNEIETAEPEKMMIERTTGGSNMKITKESIIGQVIREYPQTIAVFRAHGMGCLGCPSASAENIEKAAGIHGIDLDPLITALNEVL